MGTKKYLFAAMAVAAAVGIVLRPAELSGAVRQSVAGCLEVVIPALFAFTVLAVYLQRSRLYLTAFRPLTKPLSLLLGIPEELCAVFLLANIGGYPVGARLLGELVSSGRLSRRDAGRMLCFCYGSGPSFVIGTAGAEVFGSAAAGGVIYAACFMSALVIAVVVCRTGERIILVPGEQHPVLTAECFTGSVDAGARVMYTVCCMAAAFAAVTALLDCSGLTGLISGALGLAGFGGNSDRLFQAFLEVTRVRDMLPDGMAAPVCAALLSFGGVCVVLQILAVSGGRIPVRGLLISRLPASLMSALFALPACRFAETAAEVYSPNVPEVQPFSVNAGLSVCVMVMAGMLILSAGRAGESSRKNKS